MIGQGLQYRVYAYGNDQVKKVPNTFKQMKVIKGNFNPLMRLCPPFLHYKTKRDYRHRQEVVSEIQRRDISPSLLGNPQFEGDTIIQDRVTPLGEALSSHDFMKQTELIEAYIQSIWRSWKAGFAESTYNFTINHGLDETGQVVIIDFGECIFSKEAIARDIRTKRFLKSWSFRKDLPSQLQKYCQGRLTEALTLKELDRLWPQ